ncbi:MAG: Band 7 protein, partial [Parcubacteria group bacterium Gr01-1014_70]
MPKFLCFTFFAVLFSFLTACGHSVEVPPAHVGKLSTPSGLQEGIIPPSKLRLDTWCITCDSLILVEASDHPIKESMEIFMPKDKIGR